jgi:hypothetical protein
LCQFRASNLKLPQTVQVDGASFSFSFSVLIIFFAGIGQHKNPDASESQKGEEGKFIHASNKSESTKRGKKA